MREERCIWCNEAGGGLVPVEVGVWGYGAPSPKAHAEHRERATSYFSRVGREATRFVGAMAAALFAGVVGMALTLAFRPQAAAVATGVLTVAIGAILLRYPFATPQTVRWLGIRRAHQVVVALALLTLGVGVTLLLLG